MNKFYLVPLPPEPDDDPDDGDGIYRPEDED